MPLGKDGSRPGKSKRAVQWLPGVSAAPEGEGTVLHEACLLSLGAGLPSREQCLSKPGLHVSADRFAEFVLCHVKRPAFGLRKSLLFFNFYYGTYIRKSGQNTITSTFGD